MPYPPYCPGALSKRARPLGFALGGVLAFMLALPAMAQSGPEPADSEPPLYQVETFTLDNGLRVVLVENDIAPVVHHMMWYAVGAADEPPGQSGIAHFLEHLMFKGTTARPDIDFSIEVRRLGGRDNAFTSWDATVYHQTVASDRLAEVMALEADRMRGLELNLDEVLTERDVILEERRQRIDNDPNSALSVQMDAALFQNHPYGTPIIGWAHEMAALTLDDAQTFYDAWYAPNNAVLVVVGDIELDGLRAMVERAYGAIPAGETIERSRPMEPEQAAPRRVEMIDDRVRRVTWRRDYIAPSYYGWRMEEAAALDVAVEILGANTSSRLYQDLVVERELASNAGAFYSTSNRDYGQIIVYATPSDGVDVATLEAAVDAVIADTLERGFAEHEIDNAIERLVTAATYGADSLTSPGRMFGRSLTFGLGVEDVMTWPDDISAVTGPQALDALARALDIDRSVTGVLRPPESQQAAEVRP